jgi:hypothetical protein
LTKTFGIAAYFIIGLLLWSGCDQMSKRKVKEGDILLASVENRKMYYSDIEGMLSATSDQDSLAQLNAFIEAWLSRNVVLNEAEKTISQDLDIDKLVDDYKSSLLLHNYRQFLIQKDLDTTITKAQEEEYYNINKDQYLLAESICKARIVKIPDNAKRIERFYRNWKKNDTAYIEKYTQVNAIFDTKKNDDWETAHHYLSFLPKNKFKLRDFSKKGDIQKHDETFEYFIKVVDFKKQNEIPPLSYVKEQMRKVIINQRKKNLLKKIESNLYQNYLQANKIKVYKK